MLFPGQSFPGFIDSADIFGTAAGAEFTLGNTAAVVPQRIMDLRYGAVDLLKRAIWQEVLAADFAPEGDLTLKRREVFHADAENLGVDRIQSQFDQVGQDFQRMAVGVHEDLLACAMGDIDVVFVHGLEDFTPDARRNQQCLLCAPVVHEIHIAGHPSHSGPGDFVS